MKPQFRTTLFTVFLLMFFSAVVAAQTPAANPAGCIAADTFDPSLDYFPDKATFSEAEDLQVEYFNSYKVVTVSDAFDGSAEFTYVLVNCGAPVPSADELPEGALVIEVPVQRVIVLSTTLLPHLARLGVSESVIGVDSFLFLSDPNLRARIEAGEVSEVGGGSTINVEQTIDLEPDVVLAYGFIPEYDAHPVLLDAGVPTVLSADWREATPMGRAEWIKFVALFYNAEAAAEELFNESAQAYQDAVTLVSEVPAEAWPVVLWNSFSPYTNSWTIPGAETYAARLINDAGAQIALGELAPTTSLESSFEVIYEGAVDADLWVLNAFAIGTLDDFLAQDERYVDFAPVQNGSVWNNDNDVNENGGNNFYELGAAQPELVLQDLIAIFHPNLLPDHEMRFFRLLEPAQ